MLMRVLCLGVLACFVSTQAQAGCREDLAAFQKRIDDEEKKIGLRKFEYANRCMPPIAASKKASCDQAVAVIKNLTAGVDAWKKNHADASATCKANPKSDLKGRLPGFL